MSNAEQLIRSYKSLKPDEKLVFGQLILEEKNRDQNKDREVEVVRKVESVYKPFAVAPLGDLHLGSGAAALLTTRKYIQNLIDNHVYVVGTGDWIESIKPEHGVATLQASSPIFDQIELVQQEVLAPLTQAGLLLAIVRGHIAHEEWLVKMLGDDPWKRILGNYKAQVSMVNNGGILTLNLIDEEKRKGQLVIQVNHMEKEGMYTILGRQILDRKVPGLLKQGDWMDKALDVFEPAKKKILAILYDEVWKSGKWLGNSKVEGLMAATMISEGLNVPLLEHMGYLQIKIKKVEYTICVLDELENRGSTDWATGGIASVYAKRLDEKPGIVIGGHMPGAGIMQLADHYNLETDSPLFIAPGWGARRANWKKSGAESPASRMGLGAILMPKNYAVVAVPGQTEWEMFDALTIWQGVQNKWVSEEKILKKSKIG